MTLPADHEDSPPLAAPVEWVEDRERATDPANLRPSTEPPPDVFRREERTSLLGLLAEVHADMADAKKHRAKSEGWFERFGHELGHIKTHLTKQSLRLADLEGIQPNGLRHKRVLVVDDDASMVRVAVRILGALGCVADGATGPEQATGILAERTYDAALVDLRMPDSDDGVTLCRWIQRMWPATAIVVMSGHLEAPGLSSLRVARLCKPFDIEQLHETLAGALGHEVAVADTVPPPPRDPFPGNELGTLPSTGRQTPEAKANADAASGSEAHRR